MAEVCVVSISRQIFHVTAQGDVIRLDIDQDSNTTTEAPMGNCKGVPFKVGVSLGLLALQKTKDMARKKMKRGVAFSFL